jgi:hypothetical protein
MRVAIVYIITFAAAAAAGLGVRALADSTGLTIGVAVIIYEVDPLLPGCNATFNGIGKGFSGDDGPGGLCDDTGNQNQDIVMTNGQEGTTKSFSIQLAKDFDFSDTNSLNLAIGYANLDSEIGNPVTSFTAGSSYEDSVRAVVNDNRLGPSSWGAEHNIVLSARFNHYWNDNNATSIGFFFNRSSGRAFSYTYEDDTTERLFGESDDEESTLIYVPTGPTDPRRSRAKAGVVKTVSPSERSRMTTTVAPSES